MSAAQQASQPRPRQQPARRLLAERYRLLERIDRGGAGTVWRAHDERLDRDVAVKVLGAEADESFRKRFAQEARRAAAVSHPNVVAVYDEGRDGADAFMVMEYVRGRSLREVVAERGALPPHEAARIVSQVANALDATHAAGVIHCDVKPANVMLDDSGTAKLTDFGIARAAQDPQERELVGTARYVAPERIEGAPATERGDVYGLGLVAYELLAGQPAYAGSDTDEVLRMRLAGPPPSLRSSRLGLPAEVAGVASRALARDPDDRFASAGAFAAALSAAAMSGAGDDTTPIGVAAAMRALPRRRRRWTMPRLDSVLALAAILLVLLGVVVLFASVRPLAAPTAAPKATAASVAGPNVVGQRLDVAIRQLVAAGYRVTWDVAPGGSGAPCTVVAENPAAGAALARGQTIDLRYVAGKDCVKND